MERPNEFVHEIKRETKEASPATLRQYIFREIEGDISVFPEKSQEAVKKILAGGQIGNKMQGAADKAINEWWTNKYGFPYTKKAARTEVLMRKYGKPREIVEARTLQEKFIKAYQKKDQKEINRLKEEYQEKYPDQLEGVEIIFGFENYLREQKIAGSSTREREPYKDVKDIFKKLTEFHFLLTHFIDNNGEDKGFLEKFWAVLEFMAKERSGQDLKQFHMLQRGIITQVATMKIFEEAGFKPRLSHPSEDAFNAIDLWVDNSAIQITGTPKKGHPVFLKTDTIAFPGVEATREEKKEWRRGRQSVYHVNAFHFQKAARFHAKLSDYKEFTGKDVRGYFLVLPYQKIDFITGQPAPELVELVKEKINTELN